MASEKIAIYNIGLQSLNSSPRQAAGKSPIFSNICCLLNDISSTSVLAIHREGYAASALFY